MNNTVLNNKLIYDKKCILNNYLNTKSNINNLYNKFSEYTNKGITVFRYNKKLEYLENIKAINLDYKNIKKFYKTYKNNNKFYNYKKFDNKEKNKFKHNSLNKEEFFKNKCNDNCNFIPDKSYKNLYSTVKNKQSKLFALRNNRNNKDVISSNKKLSISTCKTYKNSFVIFDKNNILKKENSVNLNTTEYNSNNNINLYTDDSTKDIIKMPAVSEYYRISNNLKKNATMSAYFKLNNKLSDYNIEDSKKNNSKKTYTNFKNIALNSDTSSINIMSTFNNNCTEKNSIYNIKTTSINNIKKNTKNKYILKRYKTNENINSELCSNKPNIKNSILEKINENLQDTKDNLTNNAINNMNILNNCNKNRASIKLSKLSCSNLLNNDDNLNINTNNKKTKNSINEISKNSLYFNKSYMFNNSTINSYNINNSKPLIIKNKLSNETTILDNNIKKTNKNKIDKFNTDYLNKKIANINIEYRLKYSNLKNKLKKEFVNKINNNVFSNSIIKHIIKNKSILKLSKLKDRYNKETNNLLILNSNKVNKMNFKEKSNLNNKNSVNLNIKNSFKTKFATHQLNKLLKNNYNINNSKELSINSLEKKLFDAFSNYLYINIEGEGNNELLRKSINFELNM